MNILIPVDASKRKPPVINDPEAEKFIQWSGSVIAKYVNPKVSETFSALAFVYFDYVSKCWEPCLPDDHTFENPDNRIIEWYEEVELESLFPDDDKAYDAAKAAANGSSYKTYIHQEGQNFFKNFLLKAIKR